MRLDILLAILSAPIFIDVATAVELPATAPIPSPREEAISPREPETNGPEADLADEEVACRKELSEIGVKFSGLPAISQKGGCSVPLPLEVTRLSPDMELQPAAILNCRTARAAARLLQGAATKAARRIFGTGISSVTHGSAYVCRPINGSGNLSEHAFANALDISAITLADGRQIAVRVYEEGSPEANFLKEIRAEACGIFTTVLGPGTNADHAGHFHFDMKQRRNPYCR